MKSSKIIKPFGFTLVELIVVITILAILGTIAFVSFGSYSSNARDGTRISDLANISKGLEMYQLKVGSYPIPEGTILTGTINSIDVVYKGVIGDNISRNIGMSKTPLDPLDKTTRYIYGTSYDKTKYQVASILENPTAYNNQLDNLIVAPVFAAGEVAGVRGNYNQIIKFSTGATTKYWYIANVPSLVFNFSGTVVGSGVDLMTNKNNIYFVVNKNTNLPYSTNGITNINSKTPDTIIQEITNTGTTYFTGVDITSIINATDNTTRNTAIESIFGTGATPASSQLIRSFNINPANLTTTAITSQLSSLVVGNIGSVNNSGSEEDEIETEPTYTLSNCPTVNSTRNGTSPTKATILANINNYIGCDVSSKTGKIAGYTYTGTSLISENKMVLMVETTDTAGASTTQWGLYGTDLGTLANITGDPVSNNMHTNIVSWNGLDNTQKIVNQIGINEINRAAQKCSAKGTGWYLPASEELNQLYCYSNTASISHSYYGNVSWGSNCVGKGYPSTHIGTLSNFSATFYWSSTEYSPNLSRYQSLGNGYRSNYSKYNTFAVRCVSRFKSGMTI